MYLPYTYRIGWSKYNIHYYGVRFSQNIEGYLPEEDFWVRYFTSSKEVQSYIDRYGEPDIIEIRKVFNTADEARNWEDKVLRRLKVLTNDNWINDNYGLISDNWSMKGRKHSSESRALMSQKQKGRKLSEEHKRKISVSMKKYEKTPEHIANVTKAITGRKHSEEHKRKMSLWVRTDEMKKKMSDTHKALKHSEEHTQNRKAGLKKYWDDVRSGERVRKVSKHSDEARKNSSEAMKQYWADVRSGRRTR